MSKYNHLIIYAFLPAAAIILIAAVSPSAHDFERGLNIYGIFFQLGIGLVIFLGSLFWMVWIEKSSCISLPAR